MERQERNEERAPYTEKVQYFEWNLARTAEALHIGERGVFLKTGNLLPEGTLLTLRLSVPGYRRAFTVLGRVSQVVLGGLTRPGGMEISFIDLRAIDRDTIVDYLSHRPRLAA